MTTRALFALFIMVYLASANVIINLFASLNALTYLAWILMPQLVCMFIYWIAIYLSKPNLLHQRLAVAINTAMYMCFISIIVLSVHGRGGIEKLLANSSLLQSSWLEVSLDYSTLFSLLIVVSVLSLTQYGIGKLIMRNLSDLAM
jgi:hypothetical protein